MLKKYFVVMIFFLFIIILFFLIGFYYFKGKDGSMKVYFFNAGKADSAIITYEDKVIIIDTGEDNLKNRIRQYLNAHSIKTIDYLIITHFDKDHVGSASSIIQNYEVLNVLQSNVSKDSDYYNAYIDALHEKSIIPVTITGDYSFSINDLDIIVNGPEKTYEKNASNNSSLITLMKYQKCNFLFMGDAQNDRVEDYMNDHKESIDLLKLPYHGNYQKNDEELLKVFQPKYVVVSTSTTVFDDKLKDLLQNYHYYLTSDGAITVTSNGESINIRQ